MVEYYQSQPQALTPIWGVVLASILFIQPSTLPAGQEVKLNKREEGAEPCYAALWVQLLIVLNIAKLEWLMLHQCSSWISKSFQGLVFEFCFLLRISYSSIWIDVWMKGFFLRNTTTSAPIKGWGIGAWTELDKTWNGFDQYKQIAISIWKIFGNYRCAPLSPPY